MDKHPTCGVPQHCCNKKILYTYITSAKTQHTITDFRQKQQVAHQKNSLDERPGHLQTIILLEGPVCNLRHVH